MQSRVDRQIRALTLAKACAAHGARVRTISRITGLLPRDLLHLLFPDRQAVPRGRSPDSPEWYHGANLLCRAEASIVVAIYCRLRAADLSAGEALLGAYHHYCGVCQSPRRISFDRAFDLVAHTDGIWLTETQSFSLVTCAKCRSAFLAAFGAVARSNDPCPFCKLVQRYGTDPRVQSCFPARPLAAPAPMQLGMLILLGSHASPWSRTPGEEAAMSANLHNTYEGRSFAVSALPGYPLTDPAGGPAAPSRATGCAPP